MQQVFALFKLASLLIVVVVCWFFDTYNHFLLYFLQQCPSEGMIFLQDLMAPLQVPKDIFYIFLNN